MEAEGGGGDPGEGAREDGRRFGSVEPCEVHCGVHGFVGNEMGLVCFLF